MLIKRRTFLKVASLAAASLWVPRFLKAHARPGALPTRGKALVIVQLSGGNDGLNTVVPIHNDIYYRERPRLAIRASDALHLTDEAAFHPALRGLKHLYDNGELAVLHNVGYPNPDRSHFRSMDIWHSASPAHEYWQTGWIGRYLDARCLPKSCTAPAIELNDSVGLALKGQRYKGLAMREPAELRAIAQNAYLLEYSSSKTTYELQETPLEYLYKTMNDAIAAADYIFEKSRVKPSSANYPDTPLGRQLRTVASLILSDAETVVYYLSLGSFDTHINQLPQHQRLLSQLDAALAAFAADLRAQGRWKDVLVMTFSEFGRRVSQNASGGTDHGTANQMFFLGGALRRHGLLNALPNLADLEQGDLKFEVDFRQVYATVLENWLEAKHQPILGQHFPLLDFV
ncbi:MAG: DUF1501 domain-containing protein [Saprospiraceae bacterium]|nr:DUF1501 domain-containing protein [Saprospiraceae bacterium]MDW8483911.1 DUF1501 domain-containing protein [Saprospiraceae bacterium]